MMNQAKSQVLVVIKDGVVDVLADENLDVFTFDIDNFNDDPEGYQKIPARFAQKAAQLKVAKKMVEQSPTISKICENNGAQAKDSVQAASPTSKLLSEDEKNKIINHFVGINLDDIEILRAYDELDEFVDMLNETADDCQLVRTDQGGKFTYYSYFVKITTEEALAVLALSETV